MKNYKTLDLNIYQNIVKAKIEKRKLFFVLIDPDKICQNQLMDILRELEHSTVDGILVGGSTLVINRVSLVIDTLKKNTNSPIILFPGSIYQINEKADGILFLSLISGRNPEYLIGQQVLAAPMLKQSSLEVISTGYMLIDGGIPTSTEYMSNTMPIPSNKYEIAISTALAGELLGLKLIYMDGGSGSESSIQKEMIQKVSQSIEVPLIVGGGIKTAQDAIMKLDAGADVIVVGNEIEENPKLIYQISEAVLEYNSVKI